MLRPLFIRRANLGRRSVLNMLAGIDAEGDYFLTAGRRRGGRNPVPSDFNLHIRWGCTAQVPNRGMTLNSADAIRAVGDKLGCRRMLREANPDLIPRTWFLGEADVTFPAVVRPRHHSRGRQLWVVNNPTELGARLRALGGSDYYISELFPKTHEYRVTIGQGRVIWVAQKTPGNPDQVAWNVARGGRFDNVGWGDWPLKVVRIAVEGFNLTDLDFGGVDVMYDQPNNVAKIVEINSAPSMTSEYRQQSMAKFFRHICETESKERIPLIEERGGWRKFIHPCLSTEALVRS